MLTTHRPVKRSAGEIDNFSLETDHAINSSSPALRREREKRRRVSRRARKNLRERIGGSGCAEDAGGIFNHVIGVNGQNPNDVVLLQNFLRDAKICRQKKRALAAMPLKLSCELPATAGWPDQ